ncbi:MAG: recombinase family protein [Planctomycetes bacterium]|nr:recombinase family protein [Planctomycetota bacterium]
MSTSRQQPPDDPPLMRAAQYVRMSTEHQQYSTENQGDAIRDYALARGYEIVKTYADDGKSGLRLQGRDSLNQLIQDVVAGNAGFEAVLVYDVSRWGRFQDTDESAYYEHTCKRAGIRVIYCAEQFENDGSPVSTIIKGVKRAMAGEYSRELSAKVFRGQCRLIEHGYRQGGPAGFGLRRMLLDQKGESKGIIARGEHKSLQTDRVVLVKGPGDEIEVVREIYRRFIDEGLAERQIADLLNVRGIVSTEGSAWTRGRVHSILTNEKYIGNNVWNRTSFKLKKEHVVNPPDRWVRKDGVFPALIEPEQFFMARGIIQERARRLSPEEMIERLRTLHKGHGYLSGALIDDAEGLPSSTAYRLRFGGMVEAYRLAGYTPDSSYEYVEINRRLRAAYPRLLDDLMQDLESVGATVKHDGESNILSINQFYTASMLLSRCSQTPAGSARWVVPERSTADVVIVVRMDPSNEQPSDYYLIPRMGVDLGRLKLCQHNGARIDTYRFDTLSFFMGMATLLPIGGAA